MKIYTNCQECRDSYEREGINPPCEEGEFCLQDVLEEIEEW